MKHILSMFSRNHRNKNLFISKFDLLQAFADDSPDVTVPFYLKRHENDFKLVDTILKTFTENGYDVDNNWVIPYFITSSLSEQTLTSSIYVTCTDADIEDWYMYLLSHGCPERLGCACEVDSPLSREARALATAREAIWRGVQVRATVMRRAFHTLRVMARTSAIKQELMEKACRPARWLQIGNNMPEGDET